MSPQEIYLRYGSVVYRRARRLLGNEANGNAAAIRAGKPQLLDGAVRLDDATGPERIMLLACPRPFAIADVVAAGRVALDQAQGQPAAVRTIELPCTQTSFWIRKELRP